MTLTTADVASVMRRMAVLGGLGCAAHRASALTAVVRWLRPAEGSCDGYGGGNSRAFSPCR